ncbi:MULTISPECIES: hypothetical protein [Nonomuraea]|jgi:hypothetical protein|uniref:Uncharacterized protein n=1 Tax=Nonomuraea salmonea TaxID=46181 RepID=A0ABV5NV26_9ACTN
MSDRYTNVAKDNARVGVQIGKAVGGVTVGGAPAKEDELRIRLTELRSAMRRSVESGKLGPDRCEEVESELAEVDAYIEGRGRQQRGRMLTALKKVKGLLGDFGDLASIAALVLAVAQGAGQ